MDEIRGAQLCFVRAVSAWTSCSQHRRWVVTFAGHLPAGCSPGGAAGGRWDSDMKSALAFPPREKPEVAGSRSASRPGCSRRLQLLRLRDAPLPWTPRLSRSVSSC